MGSRLKSLVSRSKRRSSSKVVMGVVGVLFLVIGLAAGWWWTLPLMGNAFASTSWPEVECKILSSELGVHQDSDGTTYSVKIRYAYRIQGVDHVGDRYDLLGGSSSGRASKERILAKYPAGSRAVCRVNPEDPAMAVLSPGFRPIYLLTLIPVVFAIIGAVLLSSVFLLVKMPGAAASPLNGIPGNLSGIGDPSGRMRIKPTSGRFTRAGLLLFMVVFWNGIVSVFVFQAVSEWKSGNPQWFLAVFLVPFVAVGLFLVFLFIRSLLQLANPRVALWLTPGSPRLGGECLLEWRVEGEASRLRRLSFRLVASEEVHYRVGKNSRTDRSEFHRATVVEETGPPGLRDGSTRFTIPSDGVVPSLDLFGNKIVWQIKIDGDIPGWPDIEETYPLTVRERGGA